MLKDFVPILVVPAVPYNNGIRFLHRDGFIDLVADIPNNIWVVLSFCSGYLSISDISRYSGLSEEEVTKILSELEEMELIVDARSQFLHFHRISSFPSAGFINSFPIDGDEPDRCSFIDGYMSLQQIEDICCYALSSLVPLVGNMCSFLKLYVLVFDPECGISPGLYQYDVLSDELYSLDDTIDIQQVSYCLSREEMHLKSSVQIVITADFKLLSDQYGNRGYRIALSASGRIAERIDRCCKEKGLVSSEIINYLDDPLKEELKLGVDLWPLAVVSVGYLDYTDSENLSNKTSFIKEYVGSDQPVKSLFPMFFKGDGSFYGATSAYLDGHNNVQYAGATSVSYTDAMFKAAVEGYERWRSSQIRVDFVGSASQISLNWLDPREYFPLTKWQAKKCGLKFFTEDLTIDWTLGANYDGSEILVPSDLVYYGQKTNQNRIYFGHSSGIAAHFDSLKARKCAIVELIERDALMRNWYSKGSAYRISDNTLPYHVQHRIEHWKKQNRRLMVLRLPSRFGIVFETIIIGENYPCFVSGAAATIESGRVHEAMLKSLHEAEYNLLLAINYPEKTPIERNDVRTPSDHARFYYFENNARKLRFLWTGPVIDNDSDIDALKWAFDEEKLKIVTVDISDSASDIRVVHCFSPELVPIYFGLNSSHYTHPVLKRSAKISPNSLKMPHYFA